MSDLEDDAFQIAKYLYDNKYVEPRGISVADLRKAVGITSVDFDVADDYLGQSGYCNGTLGRESATRFLTPMGVAFVKAKALEESRDVSTATLSQPARQDAQTTAGKQAPKSVFIIYGRDVAAHDELVKFINSLGLVELSFDEVADSLGPSPFIADIVIEGIRKADAVIALFTPDEHAALYHPETGEYLGEDEQGKRWQARPNVIFEAGVAYGAYKDKTILVTLGSDVKLFSDVSGIHFIVLNHKKAKVRLRSRLAKIVGELTPPSDKWESPLISGDFEACLRRRWPFYDELHELETHLKAMVISKPSVTLFDIIRKVSQKYPDKNWQKQVTGRPFMEAVKESYSDRVAEKAFWWFIVYGFLRYSDDDVWWSGDEPTWKKSVNYSQMSERSVMLMRKLQLLGS